jgi:hypothetical protein
LHCASIVQRIFFVLMCDCSGVLFKQDGTAATSLHIDSSLIHVCFKTCSRSHTLMKLDSWLVEMMTRACKVLAKPASSGLRDAARYRRSDQVKRSHFASSSRARALALRYSDLNASRRHVPSLVNQRTTHAELRLLDPISRLARFLAGVDHRFGRRQAVRSWACARPAAAIQPDESHYRDARSRWVELQAISSFGISDFG